MRRNRKKFVGKLNQKEIETTIKVCYIRKTDRNGQLWGVAMNEKFFDLKKEKQDA